MSKELSEWMSAHQLEGLLPIFSEHDIDMDVIRELKESDLADLGLTLGQRKRFLLAVGSLCDQSGHPASSVEEYHHSPPEAETAERRQLTVMFCDLVGSTALSERFDPEDMRDLLTTYRQTCSSVIDRYSGFVARYVGDGIVVYFGYPQAHEYEAENAVRAGLEIVEALAGRGDDLLEVRIGIATGWVVVGDIVGKGTKEHHAVVGQTPNLAARLMGLAAPGDVIIAEDTQRLLIDLFEFQDLGAADLKGFAQPVRAWKIEGKSAVGSRSQAIHTRSHLTPLIARDFEIERLQHCWDEAKAGRGQVVLVSGEAGIGKSRLVRHFRDAIKTQSSDHAVKGIFCSTNHQNTTLYPVINRIEKDAGINISDSDDEKRRKISEDAGAVSDDGLILISDLVSVEVAQRTKYSNLSSDIRKLQTIDALEQYVCSYARDEPAVLVVEDLHWCDSSTKELLERIVLNRVQHLPMLVLLTFRTGFAPTWPEEHYITNINVKRLSPAESEKFLHGMSHGLELPPEVIREIIEKSDRIPLFLEEVCKATREKINLAGDRTQAGARRSADTVDVPSSLAASLMERLDRLGTVKGVAQVAATIGQSFSFEMLRDVMPIDPAELRGALSQLVRSEIIRPLFEGAGATYVFKHMLLQDAAYSSLLRRERQKLHVRIAQILERKYPEVVKREPELLGRHYANGGLAEQAIDCWEKAGSRAFANSAYAEAVGHTSNGLDLLVTLPESKVNAQRELDLRTTLAQSLHALQGGGSPEVGTNYFRARKLSRESGDFSKHFTVLVGCWTYSFISADLYEAQQVSSELLDLAEREGDAVFLAEAKRVHGMTLLYIGDFQGARTCIESALELYAARGRSSNTIRHGPDPLICCKSYLAYALLFLGYPERAVEISREVVAAAQALKHPYTQTFSLAFAAFLRQHLEDRTDARDIATRAIQLSDECGFRFWAKQQTVIRNWADAWLHESQAGMLELRKSMDAYLDMGSYLESTRFLSLMAEIYTRLGRTDESRLMLEGAMDAAERSGERFYVAEVHRIRAELCSVREGPEAMAETCRQYQLSLNVSESQNAAFWQLKAARSIARLCQSLGLCQDVSDRLLALCDGLGEGGDMAEIVALSRETLEFLEKAPSDEDRTVAEA